jgi:hypothetical protein
VETHPPIFRSFSGKTIQQDWKPKLSDRVLTWKEKFKLDFSASMITLLAKIWFGTVRVTILNRKVYEKYFT